VFTTKSILTFLDQAFERIEMPCLGNLNVDYISTRLSAYRSAEKWLLIFNSVVWWPAADGLMAMVETVGPGALGKQGFDNDRAFGPGQIELDRAGESILSISIRGEHVDPTMLDIRPDYGVHAEYGFWTAVALTDKYREKLLASQDEVARFIPAGYQHLITLDEWDHPTWDTPASKTEAFPRLAQILVSSDPSLWRPVSAPNTRWSNWQPK
jgi:hypothetical protein